MPRTKGVTHTDDCDCWMCVEIRAYELEQEEEAVHWKERRSHARRPKRPIEHTCDGSDKQTCECYRLRRLELQRLRRAELAARMPPLPPPAPIEDLSPEEAAALPIVHTCDGTAKERCRCTLDRRNARIRANRLIGIDRRDRARERDRSLRKN